MAFAPPRSACRGAFIDPSRSPRFVRTSNRQPLSRQIAVKQRLIVEAKAAEIEAGAAAAQAAVECFERVGYTVVQGDADWMFGPKDREIQIETLSGWATAARDLGAIPLAEVTEWLSRRRGLLAVGRSSIRVGHRDLFVRPAGTR